MEIKHKREDLSVGLDGQLLDHDACGPAIVPPLQITQCAYKTSFMHGEKKSSIIYNMSNLDIHSALPNVQILTPADGETYETSLHRWSDTSVRRAQYVVLPSTSEEVSLTVSIRHPTIPTFILMHFFPGPIRIQE